MDINTMCVQYFWRYRMPTTAGGWLFFALAFVFLVVGGNKRVWKKVTDNEAVRKILRMAAYIACFIFVILSGIAESKRI